MIVHGHLGEVLRKLSAAVDRMGPNHSALYLLSRVLSRISADRVRLIKYLIVAQPVGSGMLQKIRPDRHTEIVQAAPQSDFAKYFPRPERVIRMRFESGALCFSALVNNEFAGFIWLRANEYQEDEVRCTYVLQAPHTSVWDFDVYIEPKFRLSRTLARLWQAVDRHLKEQGVNWTFSRISAFNPESLAAHAKLGIVECYSAVFLLVGKLQLSLLPQRPYVHLSLSDKRRPVLRLDPPSPRRRP